MAADTAKPHPPFSKFVDQTFDPSASLNNASGGATSAKVTLSDLEAVLGARDKKKLKVLVRGCGLRATDQLREVLWWRICCCLRKDTASASIYDDTVRDVFGEGPSERQVTMPTFVDLAAKEHYHISEAGIHAAKRVCCVLAVTCPDITYAPLVFPLASLLLHYMTEADCYNALYGLIRSHVGHITQTKKAHQIMKYVISDLAKKYAKPFCTFVSKRGLQPEGVMDDWIWWIFRGLPFPHLVRVIDCFLVEGPKVLYRVALAIVIFFHKQHVRGSPAKMDNDLDRAISQYCDDLPIPPEKLLKAAFGIRGLSRKEIRRHGVQAEMYINSLRHAPLPHTIPKSDSCDSLNLQVSRSYSGPIESGVLKDSQFQTIWSWLPMRVTLNQPVLLFTSSEHGCSLNTFYGRVEDTEPTLLIIKTNRSEIFGAYCTTDWADRHSHKNTYFGTGECFVFTLSPHKKKYGWVGLKLQEETPNTACLFMSADAKTLSVGGGNGVALALDGDLFKGRSQKCLTFDNQPLVEGGDFECVTIEVFGFK